MLGRRTTRDSDAAAVARRRLAAIAAEFDRGRRPDEGSSSAPPPVVRPAPFPQRVGYEGGRHRGETGAREWGRRRLTLHHVAVLAVLAAMLVAGAAWWALRSAPDVQNVPLSNASLSAPGELSTPTSPGTPPASTPSDGVPASTTAGPDLVIDVAGRVRHPGIVELPVGSRVVDAIAAAGGARPGVDTAALNLARVLIDGEQIVVGLAVPAGAPPVGATAPSGTTPTSVNINTAAQPELETLPGIGPVTAAAIIDWRTHNGPFGSVEDLLDVSGIGDATLADIEPYVHV